MLANNKIYVATDGGLLEFDGSRNSIFDTDNGLFKINTKALASDFRNIIWAGHSDCSISLFDGNGNGIGHLSDIEEYGTFNLNRIYSSGNYIYVAADQLLIRYAYNSIFDKYDVSDSNLMTGNVSDVIVFNDTIYMAAQNGVYSITESSSNIGDLSDWVLLSGFDPGTIINKFLEFEGIVLALTSNGIYSISGLSVTKEALEGGNNILWGQIYNNEFYYTTNPGDIVFNKTNLPLTDTPVEVYRSNDTIAEKFLIEDNTIFYISGSGISSYSIASSTTIDYSFNLPKIKSIKKIKVVQDNSKLLYLTSFGFRVFDIFSEEFEDDFYTGSKLWLGIDLIEDNDDNIFVTTWSTGIYKFNKDYDFEARYTFGSAIPPPNPFYPYATHPGISKDKNGNLWITNYGDVDQDSTIVKIETDGDIIPYTLPDYLSPYSIFVDDNDWVWLGSSSQQFNERDGLGVGLVGGGSLTIKIFTGLGGIIDINRDKNNFVWIGTNSGIKYIDLNYANVDTPLDLISTDVVSIVEGPVGNMIYDIEISEINEKWFATDKGVSVLSSDNTVWRHYVPISYKDDGRLAGSIIRGALPDDAITDIEFNLDDGIVIFSSYNGITFFEDASLVNRDALDDEIATIPSPFIADGSTIMRFVFPNDGNNYNSVKIFGLNGRLIKGGTGNSVFSIINGWNGRDNDGKVVSTGIYQVIAFNDADPTIKMIGKIAVVRK